MGAHGGGRRSGLVLFLKFYYIFLVLLSALTAKKIWWWWRYVDVHWCNANEFSKLIGHTVLLYNFRPSVCQV